MDHTRVRSAITKIELLWSTLVKEKGDDPRSYAYIAAQSLALKQTVEELKTETGNGIRYNKQEKLKYQKLYRSLATLHTKLDYHPTPCKDEHYILHILDRLLEVRKEIHQLLDYR